MSQCQDTMCCNSIHLNQCDDYVKAVLDAVDSASFETLHVNNNNNNNDKNNRNKNKMIPGFDTIRPPKDNAAFWHSIWVVVVSQ